MTAESVAPEVKRPRSLNVHIATTTAGVAVMTAAIKVFGAAREALIARVFGVSTGVDAFLVAYTMVLVVLIAIGSSVQVAFAPAHARALRDRGQAAADALLGDMLSFVVLFLVLAATVVGFGAPALLHVFAPGFDPKALDLARSLVLLMLPTLVLGGLAQALGGVLNSRKRFAAPALTPGITPAVVVAMLVIGGDRWGVRGLAVATVIGAALELAVLGILVARVARIPLAQWWRTRAVESRRLLGQYAPAVGAAFLMTGNILVDQAFATTAGSGGVATITYGNRLVLLVLAVGGTAVATVMLPHFSALVADRDWSTLRHTLRRQAQLVAAASCAVALVLIVEARPLVRLFFQGGEFTNRDARDVAEVQGLYALQIPFYVLALMGLRLISALGRNRVVLVLGIVGLAVNVVADWVLLAVLGLPGIALASTVVQIVLAGSVWIAVRSEVRAAEHGPIPA